MNDRQENNATTARLRLFEMLVMELLESHREARKSWGELNRLLNRVADFQFHEDVLPRAGVLAEAQGNGGASCSEEDWIETENELKALFAELRWLISALPKALDHGTRIFADKFIDRYSPGAVKDAAQMEESWGKTQAATRWRRYEELAESFITQGSLSKKVLWPVVEKADELLGDSRASNVRL